MPGLYGQVFSNLMYILYMSGHKRNFGPQKSPKRACQVKQHQQKKKNQEEEDEIREHINNGLQNLNIVRMVHGKTRLLS